MPKLLDLSSADEIAFSRLKTREARGSRLKHVDDFNSKVSLPSSTSFCHFVDSLPVFTRARYVNVVNKRRRLISLSGNYSHFQCEHREHFQISSFRMFLVIRRATTDVIAKAAKADISVLLTATRYARTRRIRPVYDCSIAQ